MQPQYEVASIIGQLGDDIQELKLTVWQHKTLRAIRDCRTQALGGHIDVCTDCGTLQISYNSCRNRHCPKCQGHKKEEWINARTGELLPVPYFHVVFTMPDLLNPYVMHDPKKMYDCLLYTSDAADERSSVDLGGRRIIKKKNKYDDSWNS